MDYLTNLLDSLTVRFGNILPTILGAIAILIIGFFIAGLVRRLAKSLLKKTSLDESIGKKFKTSFRVDNFIAKLLYYIVVIYTLIVVLNILGVTSVLRPLENMLEQFMSYLPHVIAAGIIGFAGYVIASIASEAVGFLTERIEGWTTNLGVNTQGINIVKILKQVVFIFVFIPILIVALDALRMQAISGPATEMLHTLLQAVPKIIAAVLLLGIFFIVGKYVMSIVVTLLENLGINRFAQNIGISNVLGPVSLSKLIGNIGLFFIIFTGIIAAADKLELGQLNVILSEIFDISGRVFFGLLILTAGIFISNTVVKYFSAGTQKPWVSTVARFAIIGLFLAFALHTMGIAQSIVNLAFGLTLGALAVAFALAFGLGGREAAGHELKRFFDNMRNK